MDLSKDYYKILEVEREASEEDIKLAYRRLAKKYHPDLNRTDPNAKKKFIELKEAYDTLVDPINRKVYDNAGYNLQNIDLSDLIHVYGYSRIRDMFRTKESYYKPPPDGMYT
jgi:DnaJ-class molecular chaperone